MQVEYTNSRLVLRTGQRVHPCWIAKLTGFERRQNGKRSYTDFQRDFYPVRWHQGDFFDCYTKEPGIYQWGAGSVKGLILLPEGRELTHAEATELLEVQGNIEAMDERADQAAQAQQLAIPAHLQPALSALLARGCTFAQAAAALGLLPRPRA